MNHPALTLPSWLRFLRERDHWERKKMQTQIRPAKSLFTTPGVAIGPLQGQKPL